MSIGYYGKDYGRPEIGTANKDDYSLQDLIKNDTKTIPAAVKSVGNYQPSRKKIPYERYSDPRYLAFEEENIWRKCWQLACREEDIPRVGDRIKYDVADLSFFIVRVSEDTIKAFYNCCPHRGRTLCDGPDSGQFIQCGYHAWTWNLDGSIKWVPCSDDFPNQNKHDYSLNEVQVGCWGGNVFINPDDKCESLEKSLGILIEHFKDFPTEDRYTLIHLRKKIRANWKVTQEAFQESYHVLETHYDSLSFFCETATQYDIWDDGPARISRLITPTGVISSHMKDKISTKEALDAYVAAFFDKDTDPERGHTIFDARQYLAECKREELEKSTGMNFAETSETMLIDFHKYAMFPNFHPWMGEFFPVLYRFLPLGHSTNESLMEVRFLASVPKGQEKPAPAIPVDVDFDESCAERKELGLMGHIIDQDISNIPFVQRGTRASKPGKAFPVLGRVQEKQIAYFHEIYSKMLSEQQSSDLK